MRIAITEQDIAHIKKSAKIFRKHNKDKIGHQKSLDHIAVIFGYKDYFDLSNELAPNSEPVGNPLFLTHVAEMLKAGYGFDDGVAKSLCAVWEKLSAFKPAARPYFLFPDEFSYHVHSEAKATGSDVVDLLSSIGLPRYEWWIADSEASIHEPSVVLLNKVIPAVRKYKDESGWSYPDETNKEQITDYIQHEIFNNSRISAYEAVSDFQLDLEPFGFRILSGELTKTDNSSSLVWAIVHRSTNSFLEPVFDTQERAQETLASIALTGRLELSPIASLEGAIAFPTFPECGAVKARVLAGKIVDATDKPAALSNTAHHIIDAHGFKLIQYRDLDNVRLDSDSLDYLGNLDTGIRANENFSRSYPFLPDTADKMYGAIAAKTLSHIRKLESKFKGLASSANIPSQLPQNIIDWLHSYLVPVNHQISPDHYYDFQIEDMAKHIPHLSQSFPSDLLDEWYYNYLNDTQGYRPYGEPNGDATEFAAYLVYTSINGYIWEVVLGNSTPGGRQPNSPQDIEVGLVLLKLMLQQNSEYLDLGVISDHCRSLESWLETFNEWRTEIAAVNNGLDELKPDDGMISHGKKRTTMADIYRTGRKYNTTVVQQSFADIQA